MNVKKVLALSVALFLVACSPKDQEGMTSEMRSLQSDLDTNAATKIYFKTNIPKPGHLALDSQQNCDAKTVAEWLHQDKHMKVNLILEGHCDERGTSEYNMALGERRAVAVKNAIINEYKSLYNEDLDPTRVDIISFGKENNPEPNKDGMSYDEYLAKNRVVLVKIKEIV